MKPSQILSLTVLVAAGLLAGCSGGGGGSSQSSTLSVSLMDAPVDGVTAVYVKITAMWIKPKGNGPAVQLPMPSGPMTVNIMGLTDENAAVLVDSATIGPGDYEWIAMDIAGEPNVEDSYVITNGGTEEEVQTELSVPSGRLRLVSGFTIPENQAVKLLFDWSMRQGLVYPPGQHHYFLKPAFRMIDVTAYGVLQGTISSTWIADAANDCNADDPVGMDYDVGNVVYVFAGHGATVGDFDGTHDPITTIDATLDPATGDYVYRTVLDPGEYTVAFTCQGAKDDDPLVDNMLTFEPATGVEISNTGDVSTVNFPAVL
jgi:Domain of unknown function (DUF4382)